MALVKCKECGKEVSSSAATCPYCGVAEPGLSGPCKITVYRQPRLVGIAGAIYIYIDGDLKGKLMNDESVTLTVQSGIKTFKAAPFLETYKKEMQINFIEGHIYHIEAYYTLLGMDIEINEIANK